MNANIISFPQNAANVAANDDNPTGPGGNVISLASIRRQSRMIRTLRGVFLADGAMGSALAA